MSSESSVLSSRFSVSVLVLVSSLWVWGSTLAAADGVAYDRNNPAEWMSFHARNWENLIRKDSTEVEMTTLMSEYIADVPAGAGIAEPLPRRCVLGACCNGRDSIRTSLEILKGIADVASYTYQNYIAEAGYFSSQFRMELENSEAFLNGEADNACRSVFRGHEIFYFDGAGLIKEALYVFMPSIATFTMEYQRFISSVQTGYCAVASIPDYLQLGDGSAAVVGADNPLLDSDTIGNKFPSKPKPSNFGTGVGLGLDSYVSLSVTVALFCMGTLLGFAVLVCIGCVRRCAVPQQRQKIVHKV